MSLFIYWNSQDVFDNRFLQERVRKVMLRNRPTLRWAIGIVESHQSTNESANKGPMKDVQFRINDDLNSRELWHDACQRRKPSIPYQRIQEVFEGLMRRDGNLTADVIKQYSLMRLMGINDGLRSGPLQWVYSTVGRLPFGKRKVTITGREMDSNLPE